MAVEVREALRVEAPTAVAALVAILKELGAPPAARVSAARCIPFWITPSAGRCRLWHSPPRKAPGDVDDMTTEELLVSSFLLVQGVIYA